MTTRLLQLLIVAIPFGLFAWLLTVDIAPNGVYETEATVDQVSPFIDHLLPEARVGGVEKGPDGVFVRVTDEPAYVSFHMPKTDFDQVEVSLVFQNDRQPLVEFGPQVDMYSDTYDLQPIQNKQMESLGWTKISENGITLFERRPVFTTISEFFDQLPPISELATYDYDFNAPFSLGRYRPRTTPRTTPVSLRGYHKYFTYIKNEPLNLAVDVFDMNRTEGADDIAVIVRRHDGTEIQTVSLQEDGNTTENQLSTNRTLSVDVPDLEEGVYTVELVGTSDIFWRNLTSTQQYMTFNSRVYLGDDVGYLPKPRATTFYTDAKHLTLETFHADALQTLQFGRQTVPVIHTHEKQRVTVVSAGVVEAVSPIGDIRVTGDGNVAFFADAFFAPNPVHLSTQTDLDLLGVQYVLTRYQPPVQEGAWLVAKNTFDVSAITDTRGHAKFALSLPLVKASQSEIRVHAIRLRFTKEPLDASGFLRALRDRLPFGL